MRLVFDCETNGLLDELDTVHCLGITDLDTGKKHSLRGADIEKGVRLLAKADVIVGHNVIGFDIPALQKVYPWFAPTGIVRDTFVLCRLIWPHIKERDFKNEKLPKKFIGSHSLAAWGWRIGRLKTEYTGGFDVWSQEMQDYMDQDVAVTVALYRRCENELWAWGIPYENDDPPPGKDCVVLEHRVAAIVEKVQAHGVRFDSSKAAALVATLTARKRELTTELQERFPPRTVEVPFVPKVNNKKLGYVKGETFIKRTVVEFNPSSRQEVARRLQELGWKPSSFGKDGTPTVDETILSDLPYPEAKLLSEYYTVDKRLGQICHGREAWFRHDKNGRIRHRIHSGGAHTGRMTHSTPNLAQVPANYAPYGPECRDCFIADEGYVLVGCDADGLELRDLAGYMAVYDNGAYVETVLHGDKAKGTDMHSINAKLIGCSRDVAKVFFYAMIYGAGDYKLGEIIGKSAAEGKAARERLMRGVPALGKLVQRVQAKIAKNGFIIGLDGRHLTARTKNAALNTLLQSAGAIQMKRGLVVLYDDLQERGWQFGREYSIVLLVHDEWQANVLPEFAEAYGKAAVEAIREAGAYYSFKCPLDGQYQIGGTWKETH